MKYRDFGGTGIKTSILGFGVMLLPTVGEGVKVHVDFDTAVPRLAITKITGASTVGGGFGASAMS